jgi:hypothetical protein
VGKRAQPSQHDDFKGNAGCAYVLDEPGVQQTCGAAPQPGSPYCPHHHAVCYIISGTKAEFDRLREVEALASAVGGRRALRNAGPSQQFLRRLEQATRSFS